MRLIIYTGKGGTGKTVTSSSTAIKLSDRNHKTLLISSDPAHTLGDAFMLPNEISENYDIQEVIPNLFLLQVDPVREINKKYNNLLSYMASLFIQKGLDESISYEIAMMPGMTQLFSLLKIEEIMQDNSFDAVVLDMPASGEALRYLYLPKLVGNVGRKLMGLFGLFSGFSKIFQTFSAVSVPNNMSQFEQDFFDRLKSLANIITDYKTTSIRLVANPDSFSIENAKRALMLASLYGINVDLVIINKIMPTSISDQYFANWAKLQNDKVQEAKSNFYPLPTREAKLYDKELRGLDMLRQNAKSIFGIDDPSNIFYSENVFEVIKEETRLIMKLKVPFTNKDDFNINRSGEQLIINVKGPVGHITNVIPLPIATIGMRIINSKLVNDELQIFFEKGY